MTDRKANNSVREHLLRRLAVSADLGAPGSDEKLLDAYAHELAERIRNVHGTDEGDQFNWWDGTAYDGVHFAADLIDPKEQP